MAPQKYDTVNTLIYMINMLLHTITFMWIIFSDIVTFNNYVNFLKRSAYAGTTFIFFTYSYRSLLSIIAEFILYLHNLDWTWD